MAAINASKPSSLAKRYSLGQGPIRKPTISKKILHILIPDVLSSSEHVRSEHEKATHNSEKEEYILELKSLATELSFEPVIHRVTMHTIHSTIDTLPSDELILNLCDGSDVDGVPGPSVAKYLEEKNLAGVVGCDSIFINNTLTKNGMKDIFRANLVSTPPGFPVTRTTDIQAEVEANGMVYPLFVKVSDSYGSVGLDDDSVCHTYEQLKTKCDKLLIDFENLTVEEYIDGQEFSVLVSGNCRDENQQVIVYPPAERAFNPDVPHYKRFISFERNWDEGALVHSYVAVSDPNDYMALQDLARRAYISVSGNCYGRVDVRKRDVNGKFYVLEVNASCGLGKGSSSEFILILAGQTTQDFFKIILSEALKPSAPEETGSMTIGTLSEEPTSLAPEELNEAQDKLSSLSVAGGSNSSGVLPKTVEAKVAQLMSNPSLSVIPTPVVNVIVSAVLVDDENSVPDPEGRLAHAWGKDAAYVSELENLFRSIGLDPILHLYHVDDLESNLDRLSPSDDLIINACLGSDGLDVAQLLQQRSFTRVVGLNPNFFASARRRSKMIELLKANRLPTPPTVSITSSTSVAELQRLLLDAEVTFPAYIKPAIARSHVDGDYSGKLVDSVEEIIKFLENSSSSADLESSSHDWIVQTFIPGDCYRLLVAGDARDPNADVIVFPPALEIRPVIGDSADSVNNTNAGALANGLLRRRPSFLSKEQLQSARGATASSAPTYTAISPHKLILQMDLQDLARRAFVAVHGSCYGLVNIVDMGGSSNATSSASGGKLVVVGVSGDVRFGEDAKAGTVLNLAGLGADDLFRWLLKRLSNPPDLS